jgi:large repetitive protein
VLTSSALFTGCSMPSGAGRCISLSAPAKVTVVAPVLTSLLVTATSDTSTGTAAVNPSNTDLLHSETVTFQLTVTMSEVTSPTKVTVRLPSPANLPGLMAFVSTRLVSKGNLITVLNANDPAVLSDPDGDSINSVAVFDFGTLVNSPNNVVDANDQFVVEIVAVMSFSAANVAGSTVNAIVDLEYSSVLLSSTLSFDVVGSTLTISKTQSVATGDAGDSITYTVTVKNAAPSTASATSLVVKDTLPAQLTYTGSLTVSGATLDGGVSGSVVTLATKPTFAVGDPDIVITYKATVANSAGTATPTLANSVVATSSTAPTVKASATFTVLSSATFAFSLTSTSVSAVRKNIKKLENEISINIYFLRKRLL